MKRKRPRRRSQKAAPPPASARPLGPLQYKVIELSTVDEGALERTANEWTAKGWSLENVQFAMRESSKRPAMAFVFFTRQGEADAHDEDEARGRLVRLAEGPAPQLPAPVSLMSAHDRLRQLAGEEDPSEPDE